MTDFDFYSDEFQDNPGATFERMLAECPFHRSATNGWISVFRHADILEIVRDNETYSVKYGPGPGYQPVNTGAVLVSADPPLHGKQKAAIMQAFNAQVIAGMEDDIRGFVGGLLDRVIAERQFDLIQDVAVPIPLWVICRMLDLDFEQNRQQLRHWVEVLAGAVFSQDPALDAERARSVRALVNFFTPHIEAKVAQERQGIDPGNDLLGLLAKGRVDDERIGMAQMLSFAQFLLVAGSGTTTNLIGNFLKLMLDYPDEYAKLRADPQLLDQAIEEVLRFQAPVHGLFRTNNVPVKLGDIEAPVDTKVCLMWGAANRDPAVFEDPHRFDISRDLRTLRRNMTFGQGLHKCLGAPLARLECKVFVEEFQRRVESFEQCGEAVPFPYATLNGLDHLPIRVTPRQRTV